MYQVYILYSRINDRYYIGSTGVGVEVRLQRHNEGWTRSTRSGAPWELRYLKTYETKTEGLRRERFIKKQKSRDFLERCIDSEENEL